MKKLLLLPLLATLFACGTNENEKAIKGLKPVDVYQNLEKEGFTTEKSLVGDIKGWTNKKQEIGGLFIVETISSNTSSVESVRATVSTDINADINKTLPFFNYVASLQYENSDYMNTTKWLKNNFDSSESDTIVGGVKFTIRNPSKVVKILTLEKEAPTAQ